MLIFMFFLISSITFVLLTFLSGLSYFYAFLWLFAGFFSGYLFVGITILLTVPLVMFGKETNRLKHFYLRNLCDFVRLFILRLHIEKIVGVENLPKDTAFGAYANHRSGADPLVTLSALRVPLAFMAKDSLFKNKIASKWLKGFGILEIDRDNPRKALKEINHGTKLMEKGLSMITFPEGTRKLDDFHNLDTFKPGAFRLTTKAKLPIVPIAIVGTETYSNNYIRRRTATLIIIDKPIYYEEYKDLNSQELSDKVAGKIMLMLKENEAF